MINLEPLVIRGRRNLNPNNNQKQAHRARRWKNIDFLRDLHAYLRFM